MSEQRILFAKYGTAKYISHLDLMHTMERYFVNIETMEITDSISEALMQTVIYNARILMKEPDNYSARAEIMWAGSLSHNGLTGCGTGGGDWACHQLEHELGGVYNVTHGAGLAAIWGSWARYVYEVNPERFAQFATNVFDIPCGTCLLYTSPSPRDCS